MQVLLFNQERKEISMRMLVDQKKWALRKMMLSQGSCPYTWERPSEMQRQWPWLLRWLSVMILTETCWSILALVGELYA